MRFLLAIGSVLVLFAAVVPAGVAAPSPKSEATIGVTFSADSMSATITSSKGISNYTVVLCSGPLDKVDVSGEITTLELGGFGSPIVSVTVKSGTTTMTFESGVDCTATPPDHTAPPEDHHTGTTPDDHHTGTTPDDHHTATTPDDHHTATTPDHH